MADTSKTSDKAADAATTDAANDVVFSMPLHVAKKQDAGTGDERRFSIEFSAGDADGVQRLFVNGIVDGDTADRLELAGEYVLEVRRA
jgi:hypothetical protein